MRPFDEFDDHDWRATLDELRLLVVSAGFGAWDAAMAAALDEDDDERRDAQAELMDYAWSFVRYLKVRSSANLDRLRTQLGELVQDADGRPVYDAVVRADSDGPDEPLLGALPSDALVEAVAAFARAVSGEDDSYFEDVEDSE